MSKLETQLTRQYWERVGGTLIEEFLIVHGSKKSAKRLTDGLIILGGERKISRRTEVEIDGKDIIIVQTKHGRIGMYLLGQVLFSKLLVEKNFRPRSVKSVALCTKGDLELETIVSKQFPDIEIVVLDLLKNK